MTSTLRLAFALVFALTALVVPRSASAQQKTLKVCLISGSFEYESDKTLAVLQKYLEKNHNVKCTWALTHKVKDLPGLENLDTCDVAVLFTRRLELSGDQLERIKKYCTSGRPLVGIRTASHAVQTWLALDKEVLGGDYKGHFGKGGTTVEITKEGAAHPILNGFTVFTSEGTLYKNTGIAKDCRVLLTGSSKEAKDMPIAWTRMYKGGRIFYTSLGHQKDFEHEPFLRLLANAIEWTANRTPGK
jgi:type 1 glutamine amidotransferase